MKKTFTDDGYCFVCGPRNPMGLSLDFVFDGRSVSTEFVPRKEHQGYLNVLHGGIMATLLDEAMVKTAIALNMPAVTARMEIRLKEPIPIGRKITITGNMVSHSRKTVEARASAVLEEGTVAAEARGTLIRVTIETVDTSR